MEPKWLTWAKEIQSIAQAGLAYSKDIYDIERFQQLRDLSTTIMSEYTNIDHHKIRDLFNNETGYQTPKVDIRGSVFKDDKILLVKEVTDGKWSLPGGWAEVNLTPGENVVKEIKEESGLEVKPNRLIAVMGRRLHNDRPKPYGIYKLFILCDLIGGDFEPNSETLDSGFFSLDALPELSTGRVTQEQLEMCFDAYKNPDKPPYLD